MIITHNPVNEVLSGLDSSGEDQLKFIIINGLRRKSTFCPKCQGTLCHWGSGLPAPPTSKHWLPSTDIRYKIHTVLYVKCDVSSTGNNGHQGWTRLNGIRFPISAPAVTMEIRWPPPGVLHPYTIYTSQLLWVGFWGPKIVASSCTYLGLAQVIIVLIIDI